MYDDNVFVNKVYDYISKDNYQFLRIIMEKEGFDIYDAVIESVDRACEILKINLDRKQKSHVRVELLTDKYFHLIW